MKSSGKKAAQHLSKQGSSTFSLPCADCFSTSSTSFCIQCFHFRSYPYNPLTFLLLCYSHPAFESMFPSSPSLKDLMPFVTLMLFPASLFPCHCSLSCWCKSLAHSNCIFQALSKKYLCCVNALNCVLYVRVPSNSLKKTGVEQGILGRAPFPLFTGN